MSDYRRHLASLEAQGLLRTLRTVDSPQGPRVRVDGREVVCLCSNNYLGLASHPHVVRRVQQAVAEWGFGSGASRLVSGTMSPHRRLEARLAAFKKTEAALLFGSGYQANAAAIAAAAGGDDVILIDRLVHASIVDAARASGAAVRVFPHRDYDKLAKTLARCARYKRRLVVTDTVFSVDGDLADLPALVEIKRRYEAALMIDEAHATGVFGASGRGLAEQQNVEDDIDITVGTLSKALGGIGGFVAAERPFIEYLINTARSFIYTTAPPPAACAAAEAALDLIESEPQRRERLGALADRVRREWHGRPDRNTAGSASQIIPLVVGDNMKALELSRALLDAGFLVPAIRPPTVPRGTARLRVTLCADHDPDDINAFLAAVDTCLARLM
jgi:8-amino-7-oxononanoate synthase